MGLFGKSSKDKGLGKSEYFDIIFEMLAVTSVLTKDSIKRYIKAKWNDDCDNSNFDKALSNFETVEKGETWYSLTSKQYSNYLNKKVVVRSSIKKSEILDIGFTPFKDKVKSKVEEIINELPSNADTDAFEGQIERYKRSLNLPDSPGYKFPLSLMFGTAIAEFISEQLIIDNPKVISIISDEMRRALRSLKGGKRLCGFALRAINYNNSPIDIDEYKSITKEECLNVANTCPLFEKELAAAYNKQAFAENIAEDILEARFLIESTDKDWRAIIGNMDMAVDAACFYTWKDISKEYENGDATEFDDVLSIVIDFLLND